MHAPMQVVQRELGAMDFPFITFHSREDTCTDACGSRMLMEASPSRDKTFVPVDHMHHILTKVPHARTSQGCMAHVRHVHTSAPKG